MKIYNLCLCLSALICASQKSSTPKQIEKKSPIPLYFLKNPHITLLSNNELKGLGNLFTKAQNLKQMQQLRAIFAKKAIPQRK